MTVAAVKDKGICGMSPDAVSKFCFVTLGIGYLFPFSCLMGAVDYYRLKMPHNTDIEVCQRGPVLTLKGLSPSPGAFCGSTTRAPGASSPIEPRSD